MTLPDHRDDDARLMHLSALAIFTKARLHVGSGGITWVRNYYPPGIEPRTAPWRPLMDGHQAFMLVEQLGLCVTPIYGDVRQWLITDGGNGRPLAESWELRRAIVEGAAFHYTRRG